MPIFVADEIVTAAKMNLIAKPQQATDGGNRTFTNTTFLDLDALTGGAGTLPALAVTLTHETAVRVTLTANLSNATVNALTIVGYSVIGANTLAAESRYTLYLTSATANAQLHGSWTHIREGLTAGSSTFEMQASVSAGTGFLRYPTLIVEAI